MLKNKETKIHKQKTHERLEGDNDHLLITEPYVVNLLSELKNEDCDHFEILRQIFDAFTCVYLEIPYSNFDAFVILLDPTSNQSFDIINIILRIIYTLVTYSNKSYFDFFSQPHLIQLYYYWLDFNYSLLILKNIVQIKPNVITLFENLPEKIKSMNPSDNLIEMLTSIFLISPNLVGSQNYINILLNYINIDDTNIAISAMHSFNKILPVFPEIYDHLIPYLANYINKEMDDIEMDAMIQLLNVCISVSHSFELLTNDKFYNLYCTMLLNNSRKAFFILTLNFSLEPFEKIINGFDKILIKVLERTKYNFKLITFHFICKLIFFSPVQYLPLFVNTDFISYFQSFVENEDKSFQHMILQVIQLIINQNYQLNQTIIDVIKTLTSSSDEELSKIACETYRFLPHV